MEATSSSSSSPPPSTLSTVDSSNSTLAWNAFHTRHSSATFFKPKRYIPASFPSTMKALRGLPRPPRILEVGCGAGAALFPIMAALEGHKEGKATALAIDVSDKALSLLRSSPSFDPETASFLPLDLSLTPPPPPLPSTFDCAFLIFTLSAVPPHLHPQTLENVRACLRPGARLCFRDYGLYDMTMLRFGARQHVPRGSGGGGSTFRREEGTLSTFFGLEEAREMFVRAGFAVEDLEYACVINRNRKEKTEMRRCFLHGTFLKPVGGEG